MRRDSGFTLIELISVMLIMAITAAIIVPKIIDFTNGSDRVIELAIDELNTREKLHWHNVKLEGYSVDAEIEAEVYARRDWDLGNGTTVSETQISVRGISASVYREPATRVSPGIWSRQ